MRRLTIRNLDARVYERLKQRARVAHRSLEAEARAILSEAAAPDHSELSRWAAALRGRLAGRYKGDVTADIRADRDR